MKKLNAVWLMMLVLALGSTVVLAGTLEQALAIEEINDRRDAVMELAIGPGLTDQQVLDAVVPVLNVNRVRRVIRERDWEDTANRDAFQQAFVVRLTNAGTGHASRIYRGWFRDRINAMEPEAALAELETAIRALLLREPSTHRDDWIRELRAQHVILRDLAGE